MDLEQNKSPIEKIISNSVENRVAKIKGNAFFKKMVLSHEKQRPGWLDYLQESELGTCKTFQKYIVTFI